MKIEDMVECVLSLGARSGEKVHLTEELSDNEALIIETHAKENSSIIIEEMTTEVTHKDRAGRVGHGLPLQITRPDDNLLVLIKADPNSKEKVDGTVTLNTGERRRQRIWKRTVTHTQGSRKNSL